MLGPHGLSVVAEAAGMLPCMEMKRVLADLEPRLQYLVWRLAPSHIKNILVANAANGGVLSGETVYALRLRTESLCSNSSLCTTSTLCSVVALLEATQNRSESLEEELCRRFSSHAPIPPVPFVVCCSSSVSHRLHAILEAYAVERGGIEAISEEEFAAVAARLIRLLPTWPLLGHAALDRLRRDLDRIQDVDFALRYLKQVGMVGFTTADVAASCDKLIELFCAAITTPLSKVVSFAAARRCLQPQGASQLRGAKALLSAALARPALDDRDFSDVVTYCSTCGVSSLPVTQTPDCAPLPQCVAQTVALALQRQTTVQYSCSCFRASSAVDVTCLDSCALVRLLQLHVLCIMNDTDREWIAEHRCLVLTSLANLRETLDDDSYWIVLRTLAVMVLLTQQKGRRNTVTISHDEWDAILSIRDLPREHLHGSVLDCRNFLLGAFLMCK